MDRVSHILPKVLRKRGLHEAATASRAVTAAQGWVRKTFPAFKHSLSAVRVEHGCLVVEATDSIALAECAPRTEELLLHIQRSVPEAKVQRVRLRRAR